MIECPPTMIIMFQRLLLRTIEFYSSATEQPSSSNTPRMPHNPACPINSRLFKPLKETCPSLPKQFPPVQAIEGSPLRSSPPAGTPGARPLSWRRRTMIDLLHVGGPPVVIPVSLSFLEVSRKGMLSCRCRHCGGNGTGQVQRSSLCCSVCLPAKHHQMTGVRRVGPERTQSHLSPPFSAMLRLDVDQRA